MLFSNTVWCSFCWFLSVFLINCQVNCQVFWDKELDKKLQYLELSECPYQIEPIGCFQDNVNRALPSEILNSRDTTREMIYQKPHVQWHNYNHWLANFICQGAERLFQQKQKAFSDYIGVQFYGEIWANLEDTPTQYDKYGSSMVCINGDFMMVGSSKKPKQCGLYTGTLMTNYVYKVTRYNREEDSKKCPYFESRGCWADSNPWLKPDKRTMTVYRMNERDPYAGNWNKNLIDWKNWGKGYLGDLLCRCAKLAKKDNMKFFSIQFYGECWLSNDEANFKRDGKTSRCVDNQFNKCEIDQGSRCRAPLCAGEWKANKVYELKQGPDKCSFNPCQNGATCLTNGANNYNCLCASSSYTGKHCETLVTTATTTEPTTTKEPTTTAKPTTTTEEEIFN